MARTSSSDVVDNREPLAADFVPPRPGWQMLLWLNTICPAGAPTVQIPGKGIGLPLLRDASIEMPPAHERRPRTRSPRIGGALYAVAHRSRVSARP